MWRKIKLKEVAGIIGGGTPDTKEPLFWGGDISWLTPKDLSDYHNRYISSGERHITKLGLENSSAKILPKGSVLLTSRAPIGYIAIAENSVTTNQGFKSLVLKKGHYSLFYYYLLKANIEYIQNMGSGSTFKEISGSVVKELTFLVPEYEEQKKIAEVLGAFDDKIELLQKQNKTLEEMAKAIFKSWFVDFDIVKAKQKGEKKEDIIKNYHLTEELYDLFPSSFVDSSLGPIPTGWEVKTVGELLEFSIGGGWGNEEENQEFLIKAPVIRGTDIPILKYTGACSSVPVRFHKKSNYISRQLKEGDIVLEVAGGSKGQPVGRALFISSFILDVLPNVICASFCKLLRPNKNILLSELFYLYLEMMYQTGEIEQYQIQSTGISNFQFKQFCEDKKFVVPSMKIQKILSTKLYIDKMGNNKKQIKTLTELRDTLLPRLISGKIKV
jgi:Restriction endonuclease S subunits